MDAQLRRLKGEELTTWKRNVATLQTQIAGYGSAPPLALLNELETAQRRIKAIEAELDAGKIESVEDVHVGLLELILSAIKHTDENGARLDKHESEIAANTNEIRRLRLTLHPEAGRRILTYLSSASFLIVYTLTVIKEFRDFMLANVIQSAVIIILLLVVGVLFRALAVVMDGGGNERPE